jgi:ribonuclease-3
MSVRLESLAAALGYADGPSDRLAQALTHRSFANEAATGVHNERLEFLGDAVVGLLVAEALMEALPSVAEGTLSRLRASIVNARSLADLARDRGLGQLLRLGRGETRTGGREKDSLLADAYEAMIGAVYLDLGLDQARRVVRLDTAARILAGDASAAARDHKTQLQEWVQARLQATPVYRLLEAEGPDHDKVFTVEVEIEGGITCRGVGRSKKTAERAAAAAAWEALGRAGLLTPRHGDGEGAPAPAGSESPSPASPPEGS